MITDRDLAENTPEDPKEEIRRLRAIIETVENSASICTLFIAPSGAVSHLDRRPMTDEIAHAVLYPETARLADLIEAERNRQYEETQKKAEAADTDAKVGDQTPIFRLIDHETGECVLWVGKGKIGINTDFLSNAFQYMVSQRPKPYQRRLRKDYKWTKNNY